MNEIRIDIVPDQVKRVGKIQLKGMHLTFCLKWKSSKEMSRSKDLYMYF